MGRTSHFVCSLPLTRRAMLRPQSRAAGPYEHPLIIKVGSSFCVLLGKRGQTFVLRGSDYKIHYPVDTWTTPACVRGLSYKLTWFPEVSAIANTRYPDLEQPTLEPASDSCLGQIRQAAQSSPLSACNVLKASSCHGFQCVDGLHECEAPYDIQRIRS